MQYYKNRPHSSDKTDCMKKSFVQLMKIPKKIDIQQFLLINSSVEYLLAPKPFLQPTKFFHGALECQVSTGIRVCLPDTDIYSQKGKQLCLQASPKSL